MVPVIRCWLSSCWTIRHLSSAVGIHACQESSFVPFQQVRGLPPSFFRPLDTHSLLQRTQMWVQATACQCPLRAISPEHWTTDLRSSASPNNRIQIFIHCWTSAGRPSHEAALNRFSPSTGSLDSDQQGFIQLGSFTLHTCGLFHRRCQGLTLGPLPPSHTSLTCGLEGAMSWMQADNTAPPIPSPEIAEGPNSQFKDTLRSGIAGGCPGGRQWP